MGTTDAPCFSSLSPKRRGGALPRHVAAQLSSRPIPRGRCRTHPLLPPLLWRPSPGTEGRPDTARLRDPALAPRPHYKPRRREDYGQGKGPGSETPRWVERKLPCRPREVPSVFCGCPGRPCCGRKGPGAESPAHTPTRSHGQARGRWRRIWARAAAPSPGDPVGETKGDKFILDDGGWSTWAER